MSGLKISDDHRPLTPRCSDSKCFVTLARFYGIGSGGFGLCSLYSFVHNYLQPLVVYLHAFPTTPQKFFFLPRPLSYDRDKREKLCFSIDRTEYCTNKQSPLVYGTYLMSTASTALSFPVRYFVPFSKYRYICGPTDKGGYGTNAGDKI